jgi:elongation factor G
MTVSSDQPLSAQVFRVLSDDYVGKVSFFRVFSGSLESDSSVHNPQTGKNEKFAQLYRFQGKEQQTVDGLVAGMIGAVTKVESLQCGDTVCSSGSPVVLKRPDYPEPMVSLAVEPKSRGDEGKIGGSLTKLADQDPTFVQKRDAQTKELVISGLSTLHLETLLHRLHARFKVEVNTKAPRIPYLETITASSDVEYTHKKQTGGAGQFARVFIKVEPNERGAGYEFIDEIVGGAIDGPFRGSVDKGIQAKMAEGIYAGYPVVDVKVRLYDGKTHPVDSKDIAFQIAGREAIKKGVMAAKPVLLEPVVILEVTVPGQFMGDITGDVNGRRGRILGMDSLGDLQIIRAQVPLGEVSNYSTELKSLTGGEGSYTLAFSHYDAVPTHVAQQIVAASKKED